MPLILAIENNRQQITQLTSIVRGLGAELVLAESAEHALEALGNRVPDLILSPLLLSQQDETALTNRLRELGPAAAHVQTLSIPILATSGAKSRGKLSMLRKGKKGSGGCAPEVFAGQLAEYLERAAVEKERAAFTQCSTAATGAVREAGSAEDDGGEEVAEPHAAQEPCAPADTSAGAVDAQAADEPSMVAEATRMAVHTRAAEERRAARAAAEAMAAEARLATVEAALAAAEAKSMDERRDRKSVV